MLKENIQIHQTAEKEDSVKIRQTSIDELIILLPLPGFTIKLSTPLFNIQTISPGEITLTAIAFDEFLVQINTSEFNLITIVPSLVLEVIDPEGVVIIRIVAPPE